MKQAILAMSSLALASGLGSADAAVVNQWVQFAPNDTVLIRAIEDTPANGCPVATLDGNPLTLAPRGTVTTPATAPKAYYPVLMCESAALPAFGHTGATVASVPLKMPVANPRRILVIGDTGCRITTATASSQNCNDPAQFPLQFVANYAATFQPDLIVHTGDFLYREQPCPTGFTGCAGTPAFDNWDSWNADWFTPARNLIAAAPLALSRGNHESCNRGARGWFRLLDVRAYDQAAVDCTGPYVPMAGAPGAKGPLTRYDYTDPYVVKAGSVSLLMFDSSDSNTTAPDTTTTSGDAGPTKGMTIPQIYTQQLQAVLPGLSASSLFFVTHKSSYDIRLAAGPNGSRQGGDATQQSVFGALANGGVPAPIKLIVSGHDHQFQVVNFQDASFAPQLVVGNSGTLLDNQSGAQPQTFTPDTTPGQTGAAYYLPGLPGTPTTLIQNVSNKSEYGFTVMDAATGGFIANVYNTSSGKLARCALRLNPRSMACVQ
ncbi:MAG: metallophosphoesterase family protein [Janthinobacterium lividum]